MAWIRRLELAVSGWLVAAPFVIGYAGAPFWTDVLVGLLAAVVRLVGWQENRPWWALLPFGVWLLAAPFLLRYTDVTGALVNDVVAGSLLIVAAVLRWRITPRRASSRTDFV